MFRKLTLAIGTTAVLAAAALTPTAASAGWKHHHHYWGKHWGYYGYGPSYAYAGSECYTVKKIVYTPAGPRPRRVLVCD